MNKAPSSYINLNKHFRNNNDPPPSLQSLPPKHYLKPDSGPHSIQHQPMMPISSSPGSRVGSSIALSSRMGMGKGRAGPPSTGSTDSSSSGASSGSTAQSRVSTLTEKAKISSLNTLQKVKRVYL